MCINVTHFSSSNRLLQPVDKRVYLVIQYQPQNIHSADQEVIVVTSNEQEGVRKEAATMSLRKLCRGSLGKQQNSSVIFLCDYLMGHKATNVSTLNTLSY